MDDPDFFPDEEWRPIVGYNDAYEVSNYGRVKSHARGFEKILRPGISSNGYPTVALGRGNSRTLHSLVADAFLEPCPEGHEVRHKDDNRKNPSADNLEYGTRKDNVADMWERNRERRLEILEVVKALPRDWHGKFMKANG